MFVNWCFQRKLDHKKILFLSPRWPWPVVGGDRVKPYNLLKYLGKNYEVHFVSLVQGLRPEEEYDAIRALGINIYPIPLNTTVQGYKTLSGIFKKQPLEISYYHSRVMEQIIKRLISKHDFDLALCFFMRTAEYLKNVTAFPRVMIAEDYRSIYMTRSYTDAKSLVQKLARWWEHNTLPSYEPKTLNMFDTVTFVSQEDIDFAKAAGVSVPIELLTNGTDTEKFSPKGKSLDLPGFHKNKTIIFAGKLDVYANVLMVKKILHEIMPLVWQQVPEARLLLVGANPSAQMLNSSNEQVKIVADIPDMAQALRSASIFLHPHSGGSGIQNKLIEAMSCQNAVVTTPTGNQGIHGETEKNLLIGQNAQELANHTIELLNNIPKAAEIGHAARQHIIEFLSWQRVFTDFERIIKKNSK